MSPRKRLLVACTTNLLLVVSAGAFAVAIAELLSRGYVRATAPPSQPWAGDVTTVVDPAPDYGYALPANRTIHAVKHQADGVPCYDVTYRTDAAGRRTVQQAYDPAHPHLILFGCSVTMSEGLDDADTLAAQLATASPGYNIYNYGVHGYGPQHMLARLQSQTLGSEIVSDRGVALYVLIPAHVSRAIGDTRAFWIYTSPFYATEGEMLVRQGSFESGRSSVTRFYRSLLWLKGHSWFLSLFNVNLPLRLGDRHARLTARIIEDARRAYRQQFRGELYVVFHPTWALSNPETRRLYDAMRAHLTAAGVPLLDYARDRGLADDEVVNAACDPHPNRKVNCELATLIARDLPPP